MTTQHTTLMSKLGLSLALAVLLLSPLLSGTAMAQSDSSDIANALPAQIPEILTGGSWSNGNVGGVYRAVVVLSKARPAKPNLLSKVAQSTKATNEPERKAEVFIQWISYENGRAHAKIVKSVSIKEFNEKQLRNAFLAMDTLKDNEMTLLVTSYDESNDKDVAVSIKATTPGNYEPAEAVK